MHKRDKKRYAAREAVSPLSGHYDWDRDWQEHQYFLDRREAAQAPQKSPYRSDAEKILLLGGTILFFLLAMLVGETFMHSGTTWLMILGFIIWVPATGLLISLICARVYFDLLKPLWRKARK